MSMDSQEDNLVYSLENKLYVNLTNKCTNDCVFCIRTLKDDVTGANLWLKSENINSKDVIEQFEKKINPENKELVFCGYGEPTLKLDILIEVAKYVKKKYPQIKIRLNTNGHANLIYKKNIIPMIKNIIDSISISLNAQNEKLYKQISQPKIKNAYNAMLEFAKLCKLNDIDTTLSIVTGYKDYPVNLEACKDIAKELGVKFRERKWLANGY